MPTKDAGTVLVMRWSRWPRVWRILPHEHAVVEVPVSVATPRYHMELWCRRCYRRMS